MTGRPRAAASTYAVRTGHGIVHWVAVSHLALVVAVLAGLAGAEPAAAHAKLVAADPARDATVTSLAAVRLRFSEVLRPEFSTVAVTATDGARVVSGSPAVAGTEISVPVTVTGAGPYTVAYRVLSADGHPVEGSYAVTFAPPPAPSQAVSPPAAAATPLPTTRPASPSAGEEAGAGGSRTAAEEAGGGGGASLLGVGGGLLACAALASAGLVWRRRMRDHA